MSSKLPQPESEVPELRILLVGKTGVGKTSVMNVLMGRPGLIKSTASSETTECKIEDRQFGGQKLVVIDTPGLMNTKKDEAAVKKDIVGSIVVAAPGPHVFLLVLKPGRFSDQDKDTFEIIHKMFGEKSKNYTLALFTWADDYKPSDQDVKKSIITDYTVGHHSFDNSGKTCPDQVPELLKKINNLVHKNKGEPYTSEMLREAQKFKEQEMEKFKGDGPKEPQVWQKTVEFLLSEMVGEPWAGSLFIIVGFVIKKVHHYVTKPMDQKDSGVLWAVDG